MNKPNIAVLGATGVVGREILKILAEQNVPYNEIKFLASAKSAGKKITFKGEEHTITEATPEAFEGINIVLASAGASTSKLLAPEAVKRGCVFIDNSSAYRMDKDCPLVIVGVNDEDLKNHKGIIPNPNCSTSQLMLVLKPLHDYAKIKRLIVSTYQAVSGAGLAAINELKENTIAANEGKDFENVKFKKPIAYNVIPQIDVFCENGYTKEEMKVTIEFEKEITAQKAKELLEKAWGVEVMDDTENYVYPTPVDAAGKDPVYVGRIRKNIAFDNAIDLWCVADNIRIGAALNTVRIAQKVIEMKLY